MISRELRALYFWEFKATPTNDIDVVEFLIDCAKIAANGNNSYWSPTMRKMGPLYRMREVMLNGLHGSGKPEVVILSDDGR